MVQSFLLTAVAGVVLLGIVIFFHELGHFLAAKWRRVRVLKFSIGMGPEAFGFTHGGTRYCVSKIPLGGFVQMAGDSPLEDGSLPKGGPDEFLTHPWYGRLIIAVAGPFANLVTAYVVLVIMFLVGVQSPDYPSVLGSLPDTSAAFRAGFREGDRISTVAGVPVKTLHDVNVASAGRAAGEPIEIVVERAGAPVTFAIPAAERRPVELGLYRPVVAATVGGVSPGMPAYKGGVQVGDRILAVDGKPIGHFNDISPTLRGKADRLVRVTVKRGEGTIDLTLKPIRDESWGADKQGAMIGIKPARGLTWTRRATFGGALRDAFESVVMFVVQVFGDLKKALMRPLYYGEYMGGPVFIAQMSRDAAQEGPDDWLWLLALINVAVMAFNLLPIPLLDGGHIFLALLEAVRRRALSAAAYLNFQKVGLVFVGTLFVLILARDVIRPVQRMLSLDRAPRETTTVEPGAH